MGATCLAKTSGEASPSSGYRGRLTTYTHASRELTVSLVERRLGSVSSLGRLGRRGSSRRSFPLSWYSTIIPDLSASTLMSDQVLDSR
jgi:hypothetical protein